MKKFQKGDILFNTIKAHPKIRVLGYNGSIYVDNTVEQVKVINDFLPEPPPPPPPTEAPVITTTNYFVYTIEYDIYPIDFSLLTGVAYVLLSAPPASYPGVTVTFRRDDANLGTVCRFYDYTDPFFPFWDIPVGGQLVFLSDGAGWILQ